MIKFKRFFNKIYNKIYNYLYLKTFMDKEIKDFIRLCNSNDKKVEDTPFKTAINNILSTSTDTNMIICRDTIKQLMKYFLYKKLIFEENVTPYYEIATKIDYASDNTKNFINFHNKEKWLQLIKATKKELKKENIYNCIIPNPRDINVCKNLRFFINLGLNIKLNLKGFSFNIESEIIKKYVKTDIEFYIIQIGAEHLLEDIFNKIKYNQKTERYIVTRNIYNNKRKESIPFGFLISLCLKNLKDTNSKNNFFYKDNNIPAKTIQIMKKTCYSNSTKLLSIYDVEAYNNIEQLFLYKDNLFEKLYEYSIYDTNFSFLQDTPSIALNIIEGIFDQIAEKTFSRIFYLNLYDALKVLKLLFGTKPKTNIKFYDYEISNKLNLKTSDVKNFLDLFSHKIDNINNNFLLPSHYIENNFLFKPFIKIKESQYLLVNNLLCAPNIYECFMNNLRKNNEFDNIDTKIGHYIEKYMYKLLNNKKIKFINGVFADNKKNISGESDLIISGTNKIFCFEFKKKPFTRKAKSGDAFIALTDLADSLLESQMQANKVKFIFLNDKLLKLKNNKFMSYNNEKIYTISISFSNFGSFHDDLFIHNFMRETLKLQFNPIKKNDPDTTKKCFKINDKIKRFNKQLLELTNLGINLREHFFCCRFIPISFVLFILNRTKDTNSFLDDLIKYKNIATGNMDIWEQYTWDKNTYYDTFNKTNCIHIKSNLIK